MTHTRLEWALNPMTDTFLRKAEGNEHIGKKGHMAVEMVEIGLCCKHKNTKDCQRNQKLEEATVSSYISNMITTFISDFLGPELKREYANVAFLSHPFVATCYDSLRKLIHQLQGSLKTPNFFLPITCYSYGLLCRIFLSDL